MGNFIHLFLRLLSSNSENKIVEIMKSQLKIYEDKLKEKESEIKV